MASATLSRAAIWMRYYAAREWVWFRQHTRKCERLAALVEFTQGWSRPYGSAAWQAFQRRYVNPRRSRTASRPRRENAARPRATSRESAH
jgi:hypothetical protein